MEGAKRTGNRLFSALARLAPAASVARSLEKGYLTPQAIARYAVGRDQLLRDQIRMYLLTHPEVQDAVVDCLAVYLQSTQFQIEQRTSGGGQEGRREIASYRVYPERKRARTMLGVLTDKVDPLAKRRADRISSLLTSAPPDEELVRG
ncbi:MAG: hypothetical protein NT099_06550 [Candidatus Saganbacteria bacterium]|nr:hypothetical protein [Candidatus Saganbacteria bacterium]